MREMITLWLFGQFLLGQGCIWNSVNPVQMDTRLEIAPFVC